MNVKRFIVTLVALAIVFISSCTSNGDVIDSNDISDTINFNDYLPETDKLFFSKEDYETVSIGDDTYAVKFKTDRGFYSFDMPAYSDSGNGVVRIDIYKWKNDYETTVSEGDYSVYSLSPLSPAEDMITPFIVFSPNDLLIAGEYLMVFSSDSTDSEILIGEKTDDTNYGIVCYINGVESDKAPCAVIEFN